MSSAENGWARSAWQLWIDLSPKASRWTRSCWWLSRVLGGRSVFGKQDLSSRDAHRDHRHLFALHRHPAYPCHPNPGRLHAHVWWRHSHD